MVAEKLDELTTQFKACDMVAFADTGTKMVLVTDSHSEHAREVLDELCAEADVTLGAPDAAPLGQHPAEIAIKSSTRETRIFLRSRSEPTDVLCCICQPGINLPEFLVEARRCLGEIS